MSPEVQNRGISGTTKRELCFQKCKKERKKDTVQSRHFLGCNVGHHATPGPYILARIKCRENQFGCAYQFNTKIIVLFQILLQKCRLDFQLRCQMYKLYLSTGITIATQRVTMCEFRSGMNFVSE